MSADFTDQYEDDFDTILIQTAGKTIMVMLFMAKLFIFAVGFCDSWIFPEIVNMYTVFLGYLVVKDFYLYTCIWRKEASAR